MANRARDWLRQAADDLEWAGDSLAGGRWAQSCFIAQQVAEKALKAIALARGAADLRSHSIVKIAEALGIDGELASLGRRLDAYYISARYPDAYPEGAPFEYFDRTIATDAVGYARIFVERAQAELPDA